MRKTIRQAAPKADAPSYLSVNATRDLALQEYDFVRDQLAVQGSASAGYGNYQAFEAEGFLNLPLNDDVAMRLSARTVQQGEGYWTSRLLPGTVSHLVSQTRGCFSNPTFVHDYGKRAFGFEDDQFGVFLAAKLDAKLTLALGASAYLVQFH